MLIDVTDRKTAWPHYTWQRPIYCPPKLCIEPFWAQTKTTRQEMYSMVASGWRTNVVANEQPHSKRMIEVRIDKEIEKDPATMRSVASFEIWLISNDFTIAKQDYQLAEFTIEYEKHEMNVGYLDEYVRDMIDRMIYI